jgi:hypothetical protein
MEGTQIHFKAQKFSLNFFEFGEMGPLEIPSLAVYYQGLVKCPSVLCLYDVIFTVGMMAGIMIDVE